MKRKVDYDGYCSARYDGYCDNCGQCISYSLCDYCGTEEDVEWLHFDEETKKNICMLCDSNIREGERIITVKEARLIHKLAKKGWELQEKTETHKNIEYLIFRKERFEIQINETEMCTTRDYYFDDQHFVPLKELNMIIKTSKMILKSKKEQKERLEKNEK